MDARNAETRWARGILALALLSAASASAQGGTHVLAPGEEPRILAVLGQRSLPEGCALGDVHVDRTFVRASYRCGAREHRVELRHRDDAPTTARSEGSLALVARDLPAPLEQALRESLRAHGAELHWITRNEAGRRPPPLVSSFFAEPTTFALGALATGLLAGLPWIARRRSRRR